MTWADQTRGGYAYRIHADDGRKGTTYLGAIDVGNGWCSCEWFKSDGTATFAQKVKGDLDLVEAPEPLEVPAEVMAAAVAVLDGVDEDALRTALSAALTAYEDVRPTDEKPKLLELIAEVDMDS